MSSERTAAGETDDASGVLSRVPNRVVADWLRGALYGAAAFLAGYVVVVFLFVVGPAGASGPLRGRLSMMGFVFYNAHNVVVVRGGATFNLVASAENPAIPVVVYYLVPVVVLTLAGAAYASRTGGASRGGFEVLARAAENGAHLAVGYAALAVLGTFVFTTTSIWGTASPAKLTAALFGLAYPAVFATLGSLVVALRRRRAT